ncbi:hypothetical protein [Palleronia pelagia]|uniref:Tyr recombinase domain-containing protein n=1 Tax=Palleronia pelagia TaxID=387096 RepID=A0A1H8BE66_9RHOB|nr:hypothetical protein [Palleronia pelagia]SEM81155.1 hypothetical protein SAMN04488011_101561 [Palleronia pelagia]
MRGNLDVILKDAPAAVRRAMIEDAPNLAPGSAHVMGRFWSAARERKSNLSMPGAEVYRSAAASESTFRCLLRALGAYAPHVCTAPAREVSDEWYALRTKAAPRVAPTAKMAVGANWPIAWQRMKPALDAAPIKSSTRKRYFDSIDRCARAVAEGLASETHGFVAACELSEAFLFHPEKDRRVKPVTAANYIEGLIALGARGGVAEDSLIAMRVILSDLRDQAAMAEKNKFERLSGLMERGGYAHVADRVGQLRARAQDLPAHSAARRRCMQQAVVCAVILNKPPRKGDLVSWRIGQQITRDADGTWRAEWEQEKTGGGTETGAMWPEICDILDEWVLDGRPDRLIHARYQELVGKNWLTLAENEPYRNLPTELTHTAIGVPSHDLRTLAADYMRRHDPAHAADVIATHLGHGTRKAGGAYRTDCVAATAQALWQTSRDIIAAQSTKKPSGKRKT